jgi:hypothetical protein
MACNKKEAPAIIEEAPAAAPPIETDTSATLAEEPDLQQVGQKTSKNSGSLNPSHSADAAGFSQTGSFVVQVSVFRSSRQAAGLVEKLAAQGYPAYVAEVENPTPDLAGTYHRVRIGRFQRIADARAFGESTLRPSGYDFWVDNRKNDAVGGGWDYSSGPSYSAPSAARPVEAYRPAEPAAPSEPAAPAGDAWGTPKADEPATPAGDAWGNPKADELPGATPPAATPSTPAAKPDTGKVDLDEW